MKLELVHGDTLESSGSQGVETVCEDVPDAEGDKWRLELCGVGVGAR